MICCLHCSGERLAFGHYYLRPHETFHEPTRRFFHCELFRVPLYDLIPLDAVVGICCVMDLHTYCRVSFNILCIDLFTAGSGYVKHGQ